MGSGNNLTEDESDRQMASKALMPREVNIEEEPIQPKQPGQDANARREAALKRLEVKAKKRDWYGKENF
jgi:hypothetical protein